MWFVIWDFIASLFKNKELSGPHLKFFVALIIAFLSYMLVKVNNLSTQVSMVASKVEQAPGIIDSTNRVSSNEMYQNANAYATSVVRAIQESHKDIIEHMNLSERERRITIRQIEARFQGLIDKVNSIEQKQKYRSPQQNNDTLENYTPDIKFRKLNFYFMDMKKPDEILLA